jgi:hypothetical protein
MLRDRIRKAVSEEAAERRCQSIEPDPDMISYELGYRAGTQDALLGQPKTAELQAKMAQLSSNDDLNDFVDGYNYAYQVIDSRHPM